MAEQQQRWGGDDDDNSSASSGSSHWRGVLDILSDLQRQADGGGDTSAPSPNRPPPPRSPHPEDLRDPVVRRAAEAAAETAGKQGSAGVGDSKSLNDTSYTYAETDGDCSSTGSSPPSPRRFSRVVEVADGSVGYEVALPQESTGGEILAGGGGDKSKSSQQQSESKSPCCSRRAALLAFIVLFALGAVGAGVGFLLFSHEDGASTSSFGSASATDNNDNVNVFANDDVDFNGGSLEPTPSDAFADEIADNPKTKSPTRTPTSLPTTTPAVTVNSPTTETYKTFSFVVLGDIPYNQVEAAYLEAQL